jgi:glycosyltransferase involved in cell wall biosynthesis
MNDKINVPVAMRVHLTNVAGAGACQLLNSLLPALERNGKVPISEIYLPDRGPLSSYKKCDLTQTSHQYRRYLPNALSRIFECIVIARRWNGKTPLLVLGDLPLRCNAQQTVFVQTPHLLKPEKIRWSLLGFKYVISRAIFSLNAKYVNHIIVQTKVMRDGLAKSYPDIAEKIHVLAQPVPAWLLAVKPKQVEGVIGHLRLVYPAAGYRHKNHKLLANLKSKDAAGWPVQSLKITLLPEYNPAPSVPWIECVGFLSAEEMVAVYQNVDGLLFLSTDESYGFPLIEAMHMGLPIVCPNLAYARELCADGAIYFDPSSIESLRSAISFLHLRLSSGWRPDWTRQMSRIPKSWDDVAASMVAIACTET